MRLLSISLIAEMSRQNGAVWQCQVLETSLKSEEATPEVMAKTVLTTMFKIYTCQVLHGMVI